MKLLLDENLSLRPIDSLAADYAGSSHVDLIGLRAAEGRYPTATPDD